MSDHQSTNGHGETTLATTNGQIVASQPQTLSLQKYGSRDDLELLSNRFLLFFNVPEADRAKPDAKSAALTAAQLTIRFGLTPRLHILIVKRGGTYQAEETLEAWKDAARKAGQMGRFLWDIQTRPMEPEEIKARTHAPSRYTPQDHGYWARVIRFDLAREYKEIGLPYDPPWAAGFWRAEAYEEKKWDDTRRTYVPTGKWTPDTIPNQRGPEDVAERRAIRAALKRTFSLIQLDDLTEAQRIQRARAYMETQMAPEPPDDRGEWLPMDRDIPYEPDGDVIWA